MRGNTCNSMGCHGPALVGRLGPLFHVVGRGPARPINFLEDGPRPDLAHQFFGRWATTRPGPSYFQKMGRGPSGPGPSNYKRIPARLACPIIFYKLSARPDPTHGLPSRYGPFMGRPAISVDLPVDLHGRPMCYPILKTARKVHPNLFSVFIDYQTASGPFFVLFAE